MYAAVLLADVVKSKRLLSRPKVAKTLKNGLDLVNERHKASFSAPLEVEKGVDELGAVFAPGGKVGEVLVDLWIVLHPLRLRFSIAVGELDVWPGRGRNSVRLFDGPAFHTASERLEALRGRDAYVEFAFEDEPPNEGTLAMLANSVYIHMMRWTPRQMELFGQYRRRGSQAAVAEHLGIRQPSVSQNLNAIHAYFVLDAIDHLASRLDQAAWRRHP